MERRRFLESCAVLGGAAGLAGVREAWADVAPQPYRRAELVDAHGGAIKARSLEPDVNYLFHYPYAGTPCFLLNLGRPVTAGATLRRENGATYGWDGGVGPARSIVAFSAICAHKLAYPTREVSFIRYKAEKSTTSDAHVIHCCADHSVYDPAGGARVVSGPAPQPLAAIVLDYDAAADALYATGTLGAEQFDAFFRKYDFKLALEYGQGKAKASVGGRAVVRELTQYCRQTIRC
ncbi:MAG: twin-arginine translocation signal domain-containing protein [Betaproteobacteria bacterium]